MDLCASSRRGGCVCGESSRVLPCRAEELTASCVVRYRQPCIEQSILLRIDALVTWIPSWTVDRDPVPSPRLDTAT